MFSDGFDSPKVVPVFGGLKVPIFSSFFFPYFDGFD
jgi:hypothetical protein